MNELFFKLLDEIDPNKLNMVYSSPNGMTVLRSSEYGFRLDQIHELKRENIKLQQRIDKAIEYLKKNACYDEKEKYFNDFLPEICCKPLLKILERKEE